jgi:hypothetical protein
MARNWFRSPSTRPGPRTIRNAPALRRRSPWLLRSPVEVLEDRTVPTNVGYYQMDFGEGNFSQETAILAAGGTPVHLFDLTPADLAGIDVLDVQNGNNGGYSPAYTSHLTDIQNAVAGGMVLVIHDRHVAGAGSILPGGGSFDIIRDFSDGSNIDVLDDTTLVTHGPGGTVDNSTLDGGTYSSHGYAISGTLPGNSDLILSQTDPTHVVTFAYGYGAGTVIYSSIPLDFYRDVGFNNFSDIYAPNVLAYAATNPLGGLGVTHTTPANGSVVFAHPTQYVLNVSNPLIPGTVDASDFQVNGISATGVSYTPGSTSVTFTFASDPVTAQGLQTMHVAAGAFARVSDGGGVKEFNGSFRYDALLMQVTSTGPAAGSTIIPPATTLDLNFNEPYAASSAQPTDFTLSQGHVASVSPVNATTLRLTLSGVTTEGTLTVSMPAGAMTDVYGNPGAAFSASYVLDSVTSPFPTPLTALAPAGSMIYTGTKSDPTYVSFVGDTDAYTLSVDPGQTITVVINPDDPALRPKVTLLAGASGNNVAGTATASAAGKQAVVQTAGVPGQIAGNGPPAQTYRIVVEGAGGTVGKYTVTVYLNTAVEVESHGGASNDTRPAAQNIDGSFVQLNSAGSSTTQPARGAVLGTVDSAAAAPPVVEVEPNDSRATAQNLDGATFTVANDPDITDSTTVPHVSVNGTGDGTFDYYSFTVAHAGDRGIFDIDHESSVFGPGLDTMLFLYDSAGNLIAENDDGGGDPGSNGFLASYIDFTFAAPGTYTIAVAEYFSFDNGGEVDGTPLSPGDAYTLQVSLSGKPFVPPGPDTYTFTLNAGASATVVATQQGPGAVRVTLQNAAGATVASGAGLNDFVAPATGTYYAVVNGLPGTDYSLVVTRNAGFNAAGNSDIASAQPVLGTQVAGRQWVLGAVRSGTIDHSGGFADPSDLSSNGSAAFTGGVGRLTDGNFGESGSFFTRDAVSITSFDTTFDFQMVPGTFPMADGMTFTIQGVASTALGGAGSSLGYEGIPSSVAVKFDNWNNEDGGFPASETGLYTGGERPGHPAIDLSSSGIDLTSGDRFHVAMHYDGTVLSVTITDTVTLASASQSYTVDIPAQVGGSRAFVGFTGATGGLSEVQDVLNWKFESRPASDFYRVVIAAGQPLEVETSLPGAGSGEFVNLLDPMIRVYDSAGHLVASDDNSADGRNARVKYNVPKGGGGTYYIEVVPSDRTPTLTTGEYILSVKGNTLGHAEYFDGSPAAGAPASAARLTDAALQTAYAHALDYWAAQGVDTAGLGAVSLRIDNMVDGMLGHAFVGQGLIVVDDDAAGHGWSFGPHGAPGTVDLDEVVTHEVGHLLGFEHDDDHDVMHPTLSPIGQPPVTTTASAPKLSGVSAASADAGLFGPDVDRTPVRESPAAAPRVAGVTVGYLSPAAFPISQDVGIRSEFLLPVVGDAAFQPDGTASQGEARTTSPGAGVTPSDVPVSTKVVSTTDLDLGVDGFETW